MATVTVEVRPSLWTRVSQRLSTWGQSIKAVAKKAGGYIARAARWMRDKIVAGARWLWYTPAAQWVATKATAAAKWFWYTPMVKWVTAGIGAIIFAPNAVAVMVLVTLIGVVVLAYLVWRSMTPAERERLIDNSYAAKDGIIVDDYPVDPEPTADETLEDRYEYLDTLHNQASHNDDNLAFSELTGRMHLLDIRGGRLPASKLKKDATVSDIHRDCRKFAETFNVQSGFRWNWDRMYQAIRNEDARLKQVAKLKAEQANLAPA